MVATIGSSTQRCEEGPREYSQDDVMDMEREYRKIDPSSEEKCISEICEKCYEHDDTRPHRMSADIWLSEWCPTFREEKEWPEEKVADHGIDARLFVHGEKDENIPSITEVEKNAKL